MLFCELELQIQLQKFHLKNTWRHQVKQWCFWDCKICPDSKAMQCEFFPASFLVRIFIYLCGLVKWNDTWQAVSFCSPLGEHKTQMFDLLFFCKTSDRLQVSCSGRNIAWDVPIARKRRDNCSVMKCITVVHRCYRL